MPEDYFDDASDAEFLALAQQLDSRENNAAAGNRSSGSGTTRLTVPMIATPSRTSGSINVETSGPDTSKTVPRVLRPGFNSVIVNTQQVSLFDRRS
jgi:hypothetical protein